MIEKQDNYHLYKIFKMPIVVNDVKVDWCVNIQQWLYKNADDIMMEMHIRDQINDEVVEIDREFVLPTRQHLDITVNSMEKLSDWISDSIVSNIVHCGLFVYKYGNLKTKTLECAFSKENLLLMLNLFVGYYIDYYFNTNISKPNVLPEYFTKPTLPDKDGRWYKTNKHSIDINKAFNAARIMALELSLFSYVERGVFMTEEEIEKAARNIEREIKTIWNEFYKQIKGLEDKGIDDLRRKTLEKYIKKKYVSKILKQEFAVSTKDTTVLT